MAPLFIKTLHLITIITNLDVHIGHLFIVIISGIYIKYPRNHIMLFNITAGYGGEENKLIWEL